MYPQQQSSVFNVTCVCQNNLVQEQSYSEKTFWKDSD